MNLLMVAVLLLLAFVCQPTVIYGLKGLYSSAATAADHDLQHRPKIVKAFGDKVKRARTESRHASAAELANAKLVMTLESGDVLMRRAARGANIEGVDSSAAPTEVAAVGSGGGGKRNKNGNNNRKSNRSPGAGAENASNGARKQEKKYSAAIGSQAQQQQQQQHHGHADSVNGNGNGKGRQRQHQGHNKRNGANGNGAGAKARTESVEKTATSEKSQSTCRYAKSSWSECDPKTNVRSRTLTLKKGETNCLATRTMQKKCKKPCRYEKGTWSECVNGQMTRQDKLKTAATSNTATIAANAAADVSCEPMRNINKKCNPGDGKVANKVNKERKHKDKGQRRAAQQS